jgi:hypothetical protein
MVYARSVNFCKLKLENIDAFINGKLPDNLIMQTGEYKRNCTDE